MDLSKIFGGNAPLIHTHEYTDHPSQAWMTAQKLRLAELAAEMGVQVEIEQASSNSFDFRFQNAFDSARFRVQALGDGGVNPGAHNHTESFKGGDDAYQAAWVASAREALDHIGATYRIEEQGSQVRFRFDTVAEHGVFVELRDRDALHQMAVAKLQNNGPHSALN